MTVVEFLFGGFDSYSVYWRVTLLVTAVGRHTTGSLKFSCDDTLCELKGQFEDTYESSQGKILSQVACGTYSVSLSSGLPKLQGTDLWQKTPS